MYYFTKSQHVAEYDIIVLELVLLHDNGHNGLMVSPTRTVLATDTMSVLGNAVECFAAW